MANYALLLHHRSYHCSILVNDRGYLTRYTFKFITLCSEIELILVSSSFLFYGYINSMAIIDNDKIWYVAFSKFYDKYICMYDLICTFESDNLMIINDIIIKMLNFTFDNFFFLFFFLKREFHFILLLL